MPRRRLAALVGCSLLVSACARNAPRIEPVPAQTITFSAQTRPDSMVEGAFEGTAVISDGWISVVVKPTLTFPAGPHERWRSVTIRSFVAADYGQGTWRAPIASMPVNVWRFLDFTRGKTARGRTSIAIPDTLRFQVPIPKGAALSTSRLAFEVEWVSLYKDYGETEQNYAFSGPLTVTRPR